MWWLFPNLHVILNDRIRLCGGLNNNLRREGRARKYGRNLAIWIVYTLETMPYNLRQDYQKNLVKELKTYSFKQRREWERRNEGCINELEHIENVDITNPEHLAKLIKEGLHIKYQKETTRRIMGSLLKRLE